MTAKRKRGTPRPAETYRGAIRNAARDVRNKRGTDKIRARKALNEAKTIEAVYPFARSFDSEAEMYEAIVGQPSAVFHA